MYFKKQLKLILIISLFILGVVLSLLTYSEKFSILSFSHNRNNFFYLQNTELLKGQTIRGEFVAKENNLGILAIRFNTFNRINKDTVIFSIKQKNAKSWYYQNKYKVDQFQPDNYFTFGFPVISNSNSKVYQFEIKSISGEIGNAITISSKEPVFLSKYQFPNAKLSLGYIFKKLVNSFTNSEFIFHSIAYFLPLYFLIILLFLNLNFFTRYYLLLIINFLVIVLDILNVINIHDNGAIIFFILGTQIILFKYYSIPSKFLFLIVLILLLFVSCLLFLNNSLIAERLVIWSMLLLFSALTIEVVNLNIFSKNFKILK